MNAPAIPNLAVQADPVKESSVQENPEPSKPISRASSQALPLMLGFALLGCLVYVAVLQTKMLALMERIRYAIPDMPSTPIAVRVENRSLTIDGQVEVKGPVEIRPYSPGISPTAALPVEIKNWSPIPVTLMR